MTTLAARILALDKQYPAEPCPADPDGMHHVGCGCDHEELCIPGTDWADLVALADQERRWPLAIISCSKSKRPGRQRVLELYTGELFKLAAAAAEVLADRWVVISGRHGVLHPEDIIESYDEAVMSKSRRQREQWGQHVSRQLKLILPTLQGSQVLSFVSAPYQEFLDLSGVGASFFCPLQGLAIGLQKKKLKELADNRARAS